MKMFTHASTMRALFVLSSSLFYSQLCFAQFSLAPYLGDFNRSGAGGAAAAEDATTVFSNPAGLSRLSGQHWVFGSKVYLSSSTFENQGSTDVFVAPITGGNGGDGGGNIFVPEVYYSNNIAPSWTFGVGVNTPFGLSTEYDRDWVGRYSSVKAGIRTLNINPSVGHKLNNAWSVGVGLSVQKVEAELSSAIDFGAVCLAILPSQAACDGIGITGPQSTDGFAEIDGDDLSFGFNVGVLWEQNKTRVGLAYRSKIKHTLEGDADFTNPAQAAAFSPAFTDTNVEVPITLPEIFSISIYHELTTKLSMMADVSHTRWSRIKQFEFKYENPAQPDQAIEKNWKDTTRVAFGFDYNIGPKWDVQWGLAIESSAIPDDTYEPSIPVTDAIWLNVGGKYYYQKNLSISFGLAHIIFEKRDVNLSGQFGETLNGETTTDLDIVNANVSWNY